MKFSGIPRNGLVFEGLYDGASIDTNDGTKVTVTSTNVTYVTENSGYNKQIGSWNGSSSTSYATLGSAPGANFHYWAKFKTSSAGTMIFFDCNNNSNVNNHSSMYLSSGALHFYSQNGSSNSEAVSALSTYADGVEHMVEWDRSGSNVNVFRVDGKVITTTGSIMSGTINDVWVDIGFYAVGGPSFWFNGTLAVRIWNRALTEIESLQLWHEFNRKLGGGSDFGAYVPAPTAQFEADGSNTFVDVAAQATVTRTAGSAATDDFGITRAISTPNQSWPSVTGDSFVYWNNSGWKLEKNATGVSATGINTSNTVRAVLFFPAGVISTAQQTYLENCFKRNYPYAFRRSIPQAITSKAKLWIPGIISGTTAYDLSGNGNNGTTSGSPVSIREYQNNGLTFNGSSQSVTVPNLSGIFGVSMWVYATAVSKTLFTYTAGKTISLDGSYGITSAGITSPVYYVNNGIGQVGSGSKWMLVTVAHSTDSTSSGSWATSSLTGKSSDLFFWNEAPTQEAIQKLYFATYRN